MNHPEFAHPELAAVEVHGVTRGSFIMRGALAAGAVYGAGAIAPFVTNAFAAGATTDVDILNFALTLEYLETDFYKVKGSAVGLSGEAKTLAKSFGDEEAEHVGALTKAITSSGGKPAKKPTFSFPVTNQASFLKLAYVLENTGVGAYNGAGPSLRTRLCSLPPARSSRSKLATPRPLPCSRARRSRPTARSTSRSARPRSSRRSSR